MKSENRKETEITPEFVMWAYRLFLDREPENETVVAGKVAALANSRELRQEFMNSPEFKQKNGRPAPALTGDESRLSIEVVSSKADLETLFKHIQETWQHLGEVEPYWSVLTSDKFRLANIEENEEIFYKSGKFNVTQLFNTLIRNEIDYNSFKTCLDYGCGLGRIVRWLAENFEHVYGYDISQSHINRAKYHLSATDIQNFTLHHIKNLRDIETLPKVDLIYSVLVLQHNPPPIIGFTIGQFIKALNPGGVAFFQVPTYRLNYSFSLKDYLSNQAKHLEMEMHVFPQRKIFEIVNEEGGRPIEVIEDASTGLRYGESSNTFLIQKRAVLSRY